MSTWRACSRKSRPALVNRTHRVLRSQIKQLEEEIQVRLFD